MRPAFLQTRGVAFTAICTAKVWADQTDRQMYFISR
ncbi:hypothetical protein SAMN06265380_10979 [Ruegeria faecimaris]|uniref:Uncharacterized protein n=1 Tax=Ruegeria faecimaris TaxID=686389 RepID=A0A521E4P6_9RHOB|nr:hypothetical protein SAMN06265380_10979 [Ruegeria faecimaris]